MFANFDVTPRFLFTVLLAFNNLQPSKTQGCSASPCQYGGTCENNICSCPPGLTGPTCSNVDCSNFPCFNGGTCMPGPPDMCSCPSGLVQPFCTISCQRMPCVNGVCVGDFCNCPPNFAGPQCESAIAAYLSPRAITVTEGHVGQKAVTVQVCRQPSSEEVTLQVFTTDGSLANSALPDVDFVNIPFNAPQDVTISAGRTCTPLNVSIISDLTHEMMSKVFSLILYDLQPLSSMVHIVSSQLQTTITITDDDPVDNVPPVVSCIPDVTEKTPLGTGGRLVFYTEPTATDDSGIVSLQQRTHGPGTFFSSGVTQVTYIFVDPAGNTAECTFRVIVTEIDEVPPVIACVGLDVTETIPLNVFGTPVQFREPTAADNSGTAILQSRTHTPGQFFQSGTTQVTYVFRDPSGNTAECSFNIIITVDGNSPPQIGPCPTEINTVPSGNQFLLQFTTPSCTDPNGDQVTVTCNPAAGSAIANIPGVITCTCTDSSQATDSVTCPDCFRLYAAGRCNPNECSCTKGTCTSQTGRCEATCSVYQCPANIASESLSQVNPQSSVEIKCILEGSTAVVNRLQIRLSRSEGAIDDHGIIRETAPEISANRREVTNRVISVSEDDQFFCILSLGATIVGSINVTGFVYTTELEIQLMDIINTITRENTTTKEVVMASEMIAEISDYEDFLEEDPQRIELLISSLESVVRAGEASINVTDPVVRSINNLMNLDQGILEDGMIEGGRAVAALEGQITNFQTNDGNFSTVLDNVGVTAVKIDARSVASSLAYANLLPENETLLIGGAFQEGNTRLFSDGDAIPLNRTATSISVPSSVLDLLGGAGVELTAVPVTFIIYGNDVLFRPSMPTEVEENIEEEDNSTVTERVASQIISAIIRTENTSIVNLPPGSPVITTFLSNLTISVEETIEAHDCVVWSYDENTGQGFWTKDGCERMFHENRDLTMCSCGRLGSFAILIRVRKGPVEAQVTLYYITLIGSIISGLALVGCLIIFVSLKSFRSKQPTHIHINLCISLLGFYIAFLLSPLAVGKEIYCTVASVSIHFFCLTTLAWMSTEAMNMYYLFLKAERSTVRHFIPIACLLAYGLPAACALLVVFLDNSTDFQSASYCFIHPGYALYFGFLMEVGAMFVFNFIIFIWVIRKIICRPLMVSKTAENAKRNEVIKRVRHAILFWFVLGLSWIFGFFAAVDTKTLIFDYLYCFFISIQGILMFLLLCVANPAFKGIFCRTDSTQTKVTRQTQLGSSSQSNIPMDSMDNPSTSATE